MKWALLLSFFPALAFPQGKTELVGQIGGRTALMVLNSAQRPDGGWQVGGEYIVLPTLARRYLEGERSPELGVTTLKEGTTAILFGRDPTGELRGTWRGGVFKGVRHGPGGQERERFELSEEFPSMEGYTAAVKCQPGDGSTLAYAVDAGKLKTFEWQQPGCTLADFEQRPLKGGLRFAAGRCAVTLREVGNEVKVEAEGCAQHCAQPEAVLVDRRGACRPLRREPR